MLRRDMCVDLCGIVIPSGVRRIGSRAFHSCAAPESVTLPDSLETIGMVAFYGCVSLKQIDLPDSLSVIGGFAFFGCGLTFISIPAVRKPGGSVFYDCRSLERAAFRGNVSKWEKLIFGRCSSLTSVEFP